MELEAVDRLTPSQVDDLVAFYQNEWWTRGRRRAEVERMLAHTDVVGFCDPKSKRLLAFARVLTDSVYRALILDVIVAEAHRKRGLGRALMNAILHHPRLQAVRHFELYCLPELIPYYRQWGFTSELGALTFMRRLP